MAKDTQEQLPNPLEPDYPLRLNYYLERRFRLADRRLATATDAGIIGIPGPTGPPGPAGPPGSGGSGGGSGSITSLAQDLTTVGNTAGGAPTLLHTFVIPAATFLTNGQSIAWEVSGTIIDATVGTFTVGIDGAGVHTIDTGITTALGFGPAGWIVRARFTREDATHLKCVAEIIFDITIQVITFINYLRVTETLATQSLTTYLKAGSGNGNDIKKEMAFVDERIAA